MSILVEVKYLSVDRDLLFYPSEDIVSVKDIFLEYQDYLSKIQVPHSMSINILKDSLKFIAEAMQEKIEVQMRQNEWTFKKTLLFLRKYYFSRLLESKMSLYAEIVSFFDNFFFFLQYKQNAIPLYLSHSNVLAMDTILYITLNVIKKENFKGFLLKKENLYPTHLFLLLQSSNVPMMFIEEHLLQRYHGAFIKVDFKKKIIDLDQ